MKNRIKYITVLVLATFMLSACVKEEPQDTSASFTTNIKDNILKVNEDFTIYLDKTNGEFLTYFKGDSEETTYGIGKSGTPLREKGLDSLSISGYSEPNDEGYTFTLVARSFGNWSEDMAEDVQSIVIKVVE